MVYQIKLNKPYHIILSLSPLYKTPKHPQHQCRLVYLQIPICLYLLSISIYLSIDLSITRIISSLSMVSQQVNETINTSNKSTTYLKIKKSIPDTKTNAVHSDLILSAYCLLLIYLSIHPSILSVYILHLSRTFLSVLSIKRNLSIITSKISMLSYFIQICNITAF